MSSPLEKLRILDMSRVLAGPWAGQLLGDYGAEVIKVERPLEGDDTRHWGPPWQDDHRETSAYFLAANRNKRSITVDIATEAGQQVIRELSKEADVLLENFKVGTMAGFGLDAAQLLELNPRLIYCSVSAFGQTGSRAAEPGYDAMVQASAGLMSITGPAASENGGPQKVGVAIADIMAGMYAATAVLAALNARQRTGRGQAIDVPLYDSQVAWLANQNMNYLLSGETPVRMGTAHPNLVPYQTFATSDGDIMLAVGNDRQFMRCCEALGLPQLAADPRYAVMTSRVQHRETLIPQLEARLRERTTSAWLDRFRTEGIPAGPVNTIAEVLTNDYADERQLVREVMTADGVTVPTVANPVDFAETPVEYNHAPPRLGEHTDEVLKEWLRYSDAEIENLRRNNVI